MLRLARDDGFLSLFRSKLRKHDKPAISNRKSHHPIKIRALICQSMESNGEELTIHLNLYHLFCSKLVEYDIVNLIFTTWPYGAPWIWMDYVREIDPFEKEGWIILEDMCMQCYVITLVVSNLLEK